MCQREDMEGSKHVGSLKEPFANVPDFPTFPRIFRTSHISAQMCTVDLHACIRKGSDRWQSGCATGRDDSRHRGGMGSVKTLCSHINRIHRPLRPWIPATQCHHVTYTYIAGPSRTPHSQVGQVQLGAVSSPNACSPGRLVHLSAHSSRQRYIHVISIYIYYVVCAKQGSAISQWRWSDISPVAACMQVHVLRQSVA